MAAEYPNCVFVAFLDDVTVLGPPARAYSYAALQRLQTLAETQREMKSGMSKCDVFSFGGLDFEMDSSTQTLNFVRRLGGRTALFALDTCLLMLTSAARTLLTRRRFSSSAAPLADAVHSRLGAICRVTTNASVLDRRGGDESHHPS